MTNQEFMLSLKQQIEKLHNEVKLAVVDEMKKVLLPKGYDFELSGNFENCMIFKHPTLPEIELWTFNIRDVLISIQIIYNDRTQVKWVHWRYMEQSFEDCYNSKRNFKSLKK